VKISSVFSEILLITVNALTGHVTCHTDYTEWTGLRWWPHGSSMPIAVDRASIY